MSIDPRAVVPACLAAWGLLSGCRSTPLPITVTQEPLARTSLPTATTLPAPTPTRPKPSYVSFQELWRYAALETVWDLAASDLDGDGIHEIVAGSQDKGVYALTGTGGLLWRFAARAGVYSVEAADLDGDGSAEVVAGSDDNHLYLLGRDGRLLWSRATGSRVASVRVFERGVQDSLVMAGSWDGSVYGFDKSGALSFEAEVGSGVQAMVLGDLGGAPGLEILVSTISGEVVALSGSGDRLWSQPGAAVVVRDGTAEGGGQALVADGVGTVRALAPDGAEWELGRYGESTPVLATGAGSSAAATLVGTGGDEGEIYGLNDDGALLWRFPVGSSVWALQIADLGGDGTSEVLAGSDDGIIRVLDPFGRLVGAARTEGRVHGLLTSDLDGDGMWEIVARSGSEVYAFGWVPAPDAPVVEPGPGPMTLDDPQLEALPQPPAAAAAEILFVGDVFPCRTIEERMVRFGPAYPFLGTQPFLRAADLSVANLECPLSLRGAPIEKRFLFRARPDLASGLVDAGLDVVTLANNHMLDFGPDAFFDTLARVDDLGLLRVGAGATAEEARGALAVEVEGVRLAFLNYAALRWRGSNEVPTLDRISFAETARIRQEVAAAAEEADHVIVIMHLGTEYQVAPDSEQLTVARAAVEAGARLVVGHHSHVVQPTAAYLDGLIAYGLGNFVFDIDILERAREGAMLRVFFSPQELLRAEMIPVRIVDDVQPRLFLDEEGRVMVNRVFP
ncbi:MAG: CapA family protein [Anaerolineae bacterium]